MDSFKNFYQITFAHSNGISSQVGRPSKKPIERIGLPPNEEHEDKVRKQVF